MDLAALRTALQQRLGLPSVGDGLATTTVQTAVINSALRDLSNEHDWPWLISSASLTFSAGSAAFPTGCLRARELTINGRPAKFVPLAHFLGVAGDSSDYVWTTQATTVKITPVPDTAPTAVLYFVRSEPELSGDSDVPLLPEAYHDVLLARAAYRANVTRNHMDESVRDDNDYQLQVRKMKSASWARTGPRGVRRAGVVNWARW